MHRANKLSHYIQKYKSLCNNPAICIGKTPVCRNQWYSCGIHAIGDLSRDAVFMSYADLTRKFTLEGKQHFWRYLHMRNCVASKFKVIEENKMLDYLKRPHECHIASLFYKLINQ